MKELFEIQPNAERDAQELFAARISFLGNILSTLGDAFQTIGAGIDLQLLETQNIAQQTDSNELASIQKQLDELTQKMSALEGQQSNAPKHYF